MHRDIKPENIMVLQDEIDKEIFNIKLIDWGMGVKYVPNES